MLLMPSFVNALCAFLLLLVAPFLRTYLLALVVLHVSLRMSARARLTALGCLRSLLSLLHLLRSAYAKKTQHHRQHATTCLTQIQASQAELSAFAHNNAVGVELMKT